MPDSLVVGSKAGRSARSVWENNRVRGDLITETSGISGRVWPTLQLGAGQLPYLQEQVLWET